MPQNDKSHNIALNSQEMDSNTAAVTIVVDGIVMGPTVSISLK